MLKTEHVFVEIPKLHMFTYHAADLDWLHAWRESGDILKEM